MQALSNLDFDCELCTPLEVGTKPHGKQGKRIEGWTTWTSIVSNYRGMKHRIPPCFLITNLYQLEKLRASPSSPSLSALLQFNVACLCEQVCASFICACLCEQVCMQPHMQLNAAENYKLQLMYGCPWRGH